MRDHDEATYDYAQNFGSCMYPMRFAAMPIYSLTSEDFDLSGECPYRSVMNFFKVIGVQYGQDPVCVQHSCW